MIFYAIREKIVLTNEREHTATSQNKTKNGVKHETAITKTEKT